MKQKYVTSSKIYKTITLGNSPLLLPPKLTMFQKIKDSWLDFGIKEHSRKVTILSLQFNDFMRDVRSFVKDVTEARAKKENVKLYTADLVRIKGQFEKYRKDIYTMLCCEEQRISKYNVTDIVATDFNGMVVLLILILLGQLIKLIALPIQAWVTDSYEIPSNITNRLVYSKKMIVPATNTSSGNDIAKYLIDVSYSYAWNVSAFHNSTKMTRSAHCVTTADLSCFELYDSIASFKIAIVFLVILWLVIYCICKKLRAIDNSFLASKDRLVGLQKTYLSCEHLINFINTLDEERNCIGDNERYYTVDTLYKPRYSFIIDNYLGE